MLGMENLGNISIDIINTSTEHSTGHRTFSNRRKPLSKVGVVEPKCLDQLMTLIFFLSGMVYLSSLIFVVTLCINPYIFTEEGYQFNGLGNLGRNITNTSNTGHSV